MLVGIYRSPVKVYTRKISKLREPPKAQITVCVVAIQHKHPCENT